MKINCNDTLYQTTVFDQYPDALRQELIIGRARIINLRQQALNMKDHPERADCYWELSDKESHRLQELMKTHPSRQPCSQQSTQTPSMFHNKSKRWVQKLCYIFGKIDQNLKTISFSLLQHKNQKAQ